MGVQADERADDRADRLAAERRRAIDDDDLAAELGCLERRGYAGDSRPEHADVRLDGRRRARAAAADGSRRNQFRCQGRLAYVSGTVSTSTAPVDIGCTLR